MRALLLSLALVAAACGDAPDAPDDTGMVAQPGATATPESDTTPDVPAPDVQDDATDDAVTILFFGDSLTAGYGLPDPDLAYPALVGARLDAAGVPTRVVNAGVSGETSAGGRGRIDWALRQTTPDVFVLALGANDGLRGTDPDATHENLAAILDAVREAAPDAALVIAGMEALPNYGADYTSDFRRVFPKLAEAYGATLIPFLLDGVAGDPALNQADGLHPTAQGQRVIAETVATAVVPLAERAAEG